MRGAWRLAILAFGAALAVVLFLVLRGEDETGTETQPPPPTTQPQTVKPPPPSERPVTVPLDTESSAITRRTIDRGSRVVLVVTGLEGQEIHLHGYNRTLILPTSGVGRLAFRATLSGRFEVEIEDSHTQIADLTVRP